MREERAGVCRGKKEGAYRSREGEKSLLSDPGSELRLEGESKDDGRYDRTRTIAKENMRRAPGEGEHEKNKSHPHIV